MMLIMSTRVVAVVKVYLATGAEICMVFASMVPAGCSLTVKAKHQGPTMYAKRKPILHLTPEEKQAPMCLKVCFVLSRQDYLQFYMTWLNVTHLS